MRQVVRALLKNEEGKYLLVMHHKSDTWTLPGGHMEKGENLHMALKREIREEFNLKIKFLGEKDDFGVESIKEQVLPISMYRIHYESKKFGDVKKYEYIFHAQAKNIEKLKIQEEEIKDFAWMSSEDILKLENIFPQIPMMLKKVIS